MRMSGLVPGLAGSEMAEPRRGKKPARNRPNKGKSKLKDKLKDKKKKKKKKKRPAIPVPGPAPQPPDDSQPDPAPVVVDLSTRHAHLLRRTTFGLTQSLVTEIGSLGADAWLDQQLDPGSLSDPVGERIRQLYPEVDRTIAETRANQDDFAWDSMFALGQATLARQIWSSRQLFEVMVDFWSNHLNVTCPSDSVWDNRADYDRTVIRAHAFGKFSDMLQASAIHPAMLNYLDNRSSTKTHPNENYGRELLELHTIGVGNYSETDVLNSARIMTGWGTDWESGEAIYRQNRHYVGPVEVLGFSHSNASTNGRQVAVDYLDYLAHHRLTATRIARKLCLRFVADDPSDELVAAVADSYLANDTSIRPVLRTLFARSEFWQAADSKVRRPLEDLVATVRTLGHTLLPGSAGARQVRKGVEALYWSANDLQQAPLAWAPPTGYPDVAAAWASADLALRKINSRRVIVEGWWPDEDLLDVVNPRELLPNPLPATYGTLIDALSVRLLGDTLPDTSRKAIARFFEVTPSTAIEDDADIKHWRAGALVTLILNTARHGLR